MWEVANSAIDAAVARGYFDNSAYAGKPISGLGGTGDPDWWIKGLLADFNARIIEARRQLLGGPPVVTEASWPGFSGAANHSCTATRCLACWWSAEKPPKVSSGAAEGFCGAPWQRPKQHLCQLARHGAPPDKLIRHA